MCGSPVVTAASGTVSAMPGDRRDQPLDRRPAPAVILHASRATGAPCHYNLPMRHLVRIFIIVGVLVPAFSTAPVAQSRHNLVSFEKDHLSIRSGGTEHRFRVELARTSRQLAQGLMHRRRMAANAGMLFIFNDVAPRSMWMKNTFIPLDMLFLGPGGTIVTIVERTVPLSTRAIPSGEPASAVLELNAGTVSRLGIRTGDRVVSRHLPAAP